MTKTGSKIETYRAWAEIVLNMFRDKIIKLKIIDTKALLNSLEQHLAIHSGGDVSKIDFFYKMYGKFVDMGVGKEIFRGNEGDLGFTPNRKRKRWYSGVFYREVMKLKEIMAEKYGQEAAVLMVEAISAVKDVKYHEYSNR